MPRSRQALQCVRDALSSAVTPLSARPWLLRQTLHNRLAWQEEASSCLKDTLRVARRGLDASGPWLRSAGPPATSVGAGFEFPSTASCVQAVTLDGRYLVLARGEALEIRELPYGRVSETRFLDGGRVAGLAAYDDRRVTCLLEDGEVRLPWLGQTFAGRRGDGAAAYDPAVGLVWATPSNELRLYSPEAGEETVLVCDLPAPLVACHIDPLRPAVVFLAGRSSDQVLCVATKDGESWQVTPGLFSGPRVLGMAIDAGGNRLAFASLDRHLHGIETVTQRRDSASSEVAYETAGIAQILGKVERLTWGRGAHHDWVFFATDHGHVGGWDVSTGEVRRLDDWRGLAERASIAQLVPLDDDSLLITTETEARIRGMAGDVSSRTRHLAEVTSCLVTPNDDIVSGSGTDRSIRWFRAEGLVPLGESHGVRVSALAAVNDDSEGCLVGDASGMVWRSGPGEQVPDEEKVQVSVAEIVSIVPRTGDDVVVSDRSGGRYDCQLDNREQRMLLTGDSGWRQIRLLEGPSGSLISARDEFRPPRRVVSVIEDAGEARDLVVAEYGGDWDVDSAPEQLLVAVADRGVTVMSADGVPRPWNMRRGASASQIAFLDEGKMLAAILAKGGWLEIWAVGPFLPTIAAIDLPSEATSLAARDRRIAVGLRSGDVMSLKFEQHVTMS